MLNRVTLMGRLTRDPELRRTQNGTSVCSFSIACGRDFKDAAGEEATDFFDIVAWRTTAEFVCKYFGKGRMIVVDGTLQTRKWQDKNGNNRVSVEVLANSCYFGDSKPNDGSGQSGGYGAPAQQGYGAPPPTRGAPQGYGAPQGGQYGGYPPQGIYQPPPAQPPAYGRGNAPQQGYATPPVGQQGQFHEIEEDGELPF